MDAPDFHRTNLEQQVFSATHRDYRCVMEDGRKAVMLPNNGGLAPLATLSRAELIALLKRVK